MWNIRTNKFFHCSRIFTNFFLCMFIISQFNKMKKISYDPKDVMVTPAYSARSQYAYGSTEFDRKEIKDIY